MRRTVGRAAAGASVPLVAAAAAFSLAAGSGRAAAARGGAASALAARAIPQAGAPQVAAVAFAAGPRTADPARDPAGEPSGPLAASLARKLDPRLLEPARSGEAVPVTVWLTFTDKGERGAADLAARLAAAEAALTARARARRQRAGLSPLVGYDDLPVHGEYLAAFERRGLPAVAVSRWLNRAAVRTTGGRLAELAELPFVTRIAPVDRMRLSVDPLGVQELPPAPAAPARARESDTPPAVDYGRTLAMLRQLNVPAVHDSGYIGTGVLVCILDNGFNNHDQHEALRDVVIEPGMKRDFVDGDTVVVDTNPGVAWHGTPVMGCIAGNLPGAYVGAAFGARFALARTEVDGSETPVEMLHWGAAAEWADSLGADLITSSLGYFVFDNRADDYTYADMDGRTTDVSRFAQIAASKGILVVNAVGNEGLSRWHYLVAPSDVGTDSLIAVGAVDQNGVVAAFSSHGPNAAGVTKPDLAARGVNDTLVWSSDGPNAYVTGSGTSFSTPLVSGLAACLLQARPTWPATLVARALRETASKAASPDNRVGWGIPDGLAALRWSPPLTGACPPVPRLGLRLVGPHPLRVGGAPLRLEIHLGSDTQVAGQARVRVVDLQGRQVRELPERTRVPDCDGVAVVSWDGRGDGGRSLPPGLYIVALEAAGRRSGARVILLP